MAPRAVAVIAAALAAAGAGCSDELDPPWQLDHDRIVAVRATPPGLLPGEQATLDALLAFAGGPTSERPPEVATVISPRALAGAVALGPAGWTATAPSAAKLDEARAELKLAPGMPVPLIVGVAFEGQQLLGAKTVWLGISAQNPSLDAMMIDGAPADTRTEITIAAGVDVPLSIAAGVDDDVNWLSSCGTLRDFDLPQAFLKVEPEDPTSGELAVVRRDPMGGVAWRVWPIRAD